MEKKPTPVSATLRTYPLKDAKPIVWNVESVPEQRLRDKMAKTRCWVVNESHLNAAEEKFEYDVLEGPTAIVKKTITFAEACKDFGWDSIELTPNMQTIIPTFTIED